MRYISTRGQSDPITFSQMVAAGLAPDGGLYLPEKFPDLKDLIQEAEGLSYTDLCTWFLRMFATDVDPENLHDLVERSYEKFTHPKVAPLKTLDEKTHVLELFYGPTLSFKDMPLQVLGNLYEEQIERTGKPINVLGATSGDTGSAAIMGLWGKKGVRLFILYPNGRVAPLQERQIICTGSPNVFPLAIDGNYDDGQRAMRELFLDLHMKKEYRLSAINSINFARVLIQAVYYIYAYYQLPKESRDNVEFVVPSGNFGNILSGWLVQRMGLPVKSFKIASNQNDILYRLFTTGKYEVEKVKPSLAPSMDIQVSSNFERFLYFMVGENPERVREIIGTFNETGNYHFDDFKPDIFTASRATDDEIPGIIADVYNTYQYIIDPHTACGFKDLNPDRTSIVLATALPAKFPETIEKAIGILPTHPDLEALNGKKEVKYPCKPDKEEIRKFIIEHGINHL